MNRAFPFLFFLLACLISWTAKFFLVSATLNQSGYLFPNGLLQLIAQYGPSLAGLVIIALEYGKQGLVQAGRSIAGFRFHYRLLLLALLFELVLFHLILVCCTFTGSIGMEIHPDRLVPAYLHFIVNTVTLTLLTGLGEEIGWRGYLLPKLQSAYPILVAVLLLSLLNSLWHVRNDSIMLLIQQDYRGFSQLYLPDMGLRILISIPVVLVMVYLFNASGGSLFLMILFHGTANASYEWVKEVTGVQNPDNVLPFFAAALWLTAIYFLPAVVRQAQRRQLVIRL